LGGQTVTELTPVGDRLFLVTLGAPYVTDGTTLGSTKVSAPPLGSGPTHPKQLTAAGKGGYFRTQFSSVFDDDELYFPDGTVGGMQLVCDVAPGL